MTRGTPDRTFFGVSPGRSGPLREVLEEALLRQSDGWFIKLGFAYATERGLSSLGKAVDGVTPWSTATKDWIVGLHQGITEPAALRKIAAVPRSRIRVYIEGSRLDMTTLARGFRFHGKVIGLAHSTRESIVAILASSANLSAAALSTNPKNFEAGAFLIDSMLSEETARAFNLWWNIAWRASTPLTPAMIDRYAALRDEYLKRNPDSYQALESPTEDRTRLATTLWIDAGAMSGGSRNQVEFARDLARFFGAPSKVSVLLRIKRSGGLEWADRPLSPKTTTFGVDIWRLSLPTSAKGGFAYQHQIIALKKKTDGAGPYFELEVTTPNSRKHTNWRRAAHKNGYVGLTSGNRAYGVF